MYQHNYYLTGEPIARVDKHNPWRGIAKKKLSSKVQLRLEWIIFYFTVGNKNATKTAGYFGIARSIFYFWLSRFNETKLETLEDRSSKPKNTSRWEPEPKVLVRMIKLRKKYIHWSKIKLAIVYETEYGEKILSWQFQRVIVEFNLYPQRKQRSYSKKGRQETVDQFWYPAIH